MHTRVLKNSDIEPIPARSVKDVLSIIKKIEYGPGKYSDWREMIQKKSNAKKSIRIPP